MLKIRLIFLLSVFAIMLSDCKRKDEIINPDSKIKLSFDRDTIIFDTTVFTGIKTITKRLKVFNTSKNAVEISEISVDANSAWSLIIDGKKTNVVYDYFLRGNDSILILLEANFEQTGMDTVVIIEELLKFYTNGNEQFVVLVAPGIDVYFHNAETICNEIWKNNKPHVIFNDVLVSEGCKLIIEEGTKIYSHGKSGIYVEGSLEAIGSPDRRIIFTDDRIESCYNDMPGIWSGIYFTQNSTGNVLQWTHISNAGNGIYINSELADGTADLVIGNSIINTIGNNLSGAPSFNDKYLRETVPTGFGLYAVNSDVYMENTLVTNCASTSILVLLNGTYNFINNTFANYSVSYNCPVFTSFSRSKDLFTFLASPVITNSSGAVVESGTMNLLLVNNIIWGEKNDSDVEKTKDEMIIFSTNEYPINLFAYNNLLKTEAYKDAFNVNGNILNEDPFLTNDFSKDKYDFTLKTNSPAIDKGIALPDPVLPISLLEPNDLNNKNRVNNWDIGCYEYSE